MSTRTSRRSAAGSAEGTLNPTTIPFFDRSRLVKELQARGLAVTGSRDVMADRLYDFVVSGIVDAPVVASQSAEEPKEDENGGVTVKEEPVEHNEPVPAKGRGRGAKKVESTPKQETAEKEKETPIARGRVTKRKTTGPVSTPSAPAEDVVSVSKDSTPAPSGKKGRRSVRFADESPKEEEVVAEERESTPITTVVSILKKGSAAKGRGKVPAPSSQNSTPSVIPPTRTRRSRGTVDGSETEEVKMEQTPTVEQTPKAGRTRAKTTVTPVASEIPPIIDSDEEEEDDEPLSAFKSHKEVEEGGEGEQPAPSAVTNGSMDDEEMPFLEMQSTSGSGQKKIDEEENTVAPEKEDFSESYYMVPVVLPPGFTPPPTEETPEGGRPKRRRIARVIASPPPDVPRQRRRTRTSFTAPEEDSSEVTTVSVDLPTQPVHVLSGMEDIFDSGEGDEPKQEAVVEEKKEKEKKTPLVPSEDDNDGLMVVDVQPINPVEPVQKPEKKKEKEQVEKEKEREKTLKKKEMKEDKNYRPEKEKEKEKRRSSINEKSSDRKGSHDKGGGGGDRQREGAGSSRPSSKPTVVEMWKQKLEEMKIEKAKEQQAQSALSGVPPASATTGAGDVKPVVEGKQPAAKLAGRDKRGSMSSSTNPLSNKPSTPRVVLPANASSSGDVLNSILGQQQQFMQVWDRRERSGDDNRTPEKKRQRQEELRRKEHERQQQARLDLMHRSSRVPVMDPLIPPPPAPPTLFKPSLPIRSEPSPSPRSNQSTPTQNAPMPAWASTIPPPPPPPKMKRAAPTAPPPSSLQSASSHPFTHSHPLIPPPPPPPRPRSSASAASSGSARSSARNTPQNLEHPLSIDTRFHSGNSTAENSPLVSQSSSASSSRRTSIENDDFVKTLRKMREKKEVEECVRALVDNVVRMEKLETVKKVDREEKSSVSPIPQHNVPSTSIAASGELRGDRREFAHEPLPKDSPKEGKEEEEVSDENTPMEEDEEEDECTVVKTVQSVVIDKDEDSQSRDRRSDSDNDESDRGTKEDEENDSSKSSSPEKENRNESEGNSPQSKSSVANLDSAKATLLVSVAKDFFNKMRSRDPMKEEALVYSQMEPDEGYEVAEVEKELPEFHGEPVPSDDDDALFEAAAGIPVQNRTSRKKKMMEIEEEALPTEDTVQLDYYNADLHIKSADKLPWVIQPEVSDGLALMWGGVRATYGLPLPYKYAFPVKKLKEEVVEEEKETVEEQPTEAVEEYEPMAVDPSEDEPIEMAEGDEEKEMVEEEEEGYVPSCVQSMGELGGIDSEVTVTESGEVIEPYVPEAIVPSVEEVMVDEEEEDVEMAEVIDEKDVSLESPSSPGITVVRRDEDDDDADSDIIELVENTDDQEENNVQEEEYRPRKLAFQIKILEHIPIKHIPFEEVEAHDVRIGFSLRSASTLLGEHSKSWCFTGLGRKATNNTFTEYGQSVDIGDVVTAVLDIDQCEIEFWVNDKSMGVAFTNVQLPADEVIFPHIGVKNCKVAVNMGVYPDDKEQWPDHPDWTFPSFIDLRTMSRGRVAPVSKENCTVLMMVGLPGVGKSTWVRHYLRDHPNEDWTMISTDTVLNAMKVNGMPRSRIHLGRWDMIMGLAAKSMNRFINLACRRRRNYIIDGTNVNKDVRKRRLMNFKDFCRKCVVIMPSDDEWHSRLQRQARQDGTTIMPLECMLELKATVSIPNPEHEPIEDVHFIEPPLQRIQDAVDLVARYNEEARPWYQSKYQRGRRRRGGMRYNNDGNRRDFERRDSNAFDGNRQRNGGFEGRRDSGTFGGVDTNRRESADMSPIGTTNSTGQPSPVVSASSSGVSLTFTSLPPPSSISSSGNRLSGGGGMAVCQQQPSPLSLTSLPPSSSDTLSHPSPISVPISSSLSLIVDMSQPPPSITTPLVINTPVSTVAVDTVDTVLGGSVDVVVSTESPKQLESPTIVGAPVRYGIPQQPQRPAGIPRSQLAARAKAKEEAQTQGAQTHLLIGPVLPSTIGTTTPTSTPLTVATSDEQQQSTAMSAPSPMNYVPQSSSPSIVNTTVLGGQQQQQQYDQQMYDMHQQQQQLQSVHPTQPLVVHTQQQQQMQVQQQQQMYDPSTSGSFYQQNPPVQSLSSPMTHQPIHTQQQMDYSSTVYHQQSPVVQNTVPQLYDYENLQQYSQPPPTAYYGGQQQQHQYMQPQQQMSAYSPYTHSLPPSMSHPPPSHMGMNVHLPPPNMIHSQPTTPQQQLPYPGISIDFSLPPPTWTTGAQQGGQGGGGYM